MWKATNEPHFSLASCPVMLFFDSQLNNAMTLEERSRWEKGLCANS